jgi:hypothetical protein
LVSSVRAAGRRLVLVGAPRRAAGVFGEVDVVEARGRTASICSLQAAGLSWRW